MVVDVAGLEVNIIQAPGWTIGESAGNGHHENQIAGDLPEQGRLEEWLLVGVHVSM